RGRRGARSSAGRGTSRARLAAGHAAAGGVPRGSAVVRPRAAPAAPRTGRSRPPAGGPGLRGGPGL
ncbi:MAG: hypothetical protein AVDCRST_MAG85-3992, partial [uncultured Solirubrobacteraceae bacterium]